jgi:hypothetical protein
MCPFWTELPRAYTKLNHRPIGITGSSMPEEVCGRLRLGKRCDPKKPGGLSKGSTGTNIIVTGFAPVRSWGVCHLPRHAPTPGGSQLTDGLCYYWNHNPHEVQREISCWMKQRPPAAHGPPTSVIPMVPMVCAGLTGCLFLIVDYQQPTLAGHTNMTNAGGSAQAGSSTQAGMGAHEVDPPFVNQNLVEKLREDFTEATDPRYAYHHS